MTTRRQLIAGAAALGATTIPGLAQPRRHRVGVIGSGWFGKLNLHALMQVAPVEVVALNDVDRKMLEDAAKEVVSYPDTAARQTRAPALYGDYRTMLAKHKFDIVIVATPDHWHALPAIAVLESGAHLYLEKPVSIDIAEGQSIAEAAKKSGRVVQVGTQRRNSPCHVEARERIVREGRLGKAGLIEIFAYSRQPSPPFPPPATPPEGLDWNFYCGPAPLVAYNPGIHPRRWRAFRAFGNGSIGDWGVHFIDTTRWMLGLGRPRTVSATGGRFFDTQHVATVPDTQTAEIRFDDAPMTWTRRDWGSVPAEAAGWAAAIHGDKGTLKLGSAKYEFTPSGGGATVSGNNDAEYAKFPHDRERGEGDMQLLALTRAHMRDFLKAIETKGRPSASIEEGNISTSCCILANMAMDLGRSLAWDGQRIVGDAEAQKKLARPYRAPWTHPGAGV